jgi:hypothetical protein
MVTTYAAFAVDLAVDVSAIFLLAYVLHFRRHRRADLLLAYVALNVGVFAATALLTAVRPDVGLGIGLLAVLSVVGPRPSAVTPHDAAYAVVALVTGLVNGLGLDDRRLVVMINVLLLVTVLVVDSGRLRERARRTQVTLDVVHADDAASDLVPHGAPAPAHPALVVPYGVPAAPGAAAAPRGAPPRRCRGRRPGRGGRGLPVPGRRRVGRRVRRGGGRRGDAGRGGGDAAGTPAAAAPQRGARPAAAALRAVTGPRRGPSACRC